MKQAQLLFTSISDYDQGKIGNNLMCVVYKQNYTYCLVGVQGFVNVAAISNNTYKQITFITH